MARTKQTERKPEMWSAATPVHSPSAPNVKSPGQPRELSDSDRNKLKEFLESSDKPFSIKTVSLASGKKRKRSNPNLHTQTDLFEDRLTVQYEIQPANNWESLRRYKKFTVGSESIAVGECVLVKHDTTNDAKIDIDAQWKAKVLEVRALDQEHVYIRVAWLNRPEDLDTGRKVYHGKHELIPTNQLDIIDAMTVNGRLELYHWDDNDEDSPMPGTDEHFWRQTLDSANTKTFSKLRSICVDRAPQNPDQLILQCGNPSCREWMHLRCIAERAAQRANEGTSSRATGPKKKRKVSTHANVVVTPPAQAAARADSYLAQVFIAGLPDGPDDQPEQRSRIVIKHDDEDALKEEDLKCLFCETAID